MWRRIVRPRVLVGLAVLGLALWYLDTRRFTPERWREEYPDLTINAGCPRYSMVHHLTWFYLRVGQTTREETMRLLGKDGFRELRGGCLRYPIGVCEGSDYYYLLVCFDDNGKLTRADRCGPRIRLSC
jgi:hypothetical protein